MTEQTAPDVSGQGHSLRARNTAAQQAADQRAQRVRIVAFGAVVVLVLGVGGFLAFGDFLKRAPATAGAIGVQSSMAGFTPAAIRVKAGATAMLDWWTDDSAMHLEGGVHTLISPGLGLYETLPAEGRRAVAFDVPDRPGTYDVYCDTCCGGKDSPTMHGTIVVEA